MEWREVGDWLKNNAGAGAALVGSLLTGNIPGAVAAGVSLVSSATGQASPDAALAQLQSDPASVLKLRELALQNEASIREHIRAMTELELTDKQKAHTEQQQTIRTGDTAEDPYVRHTRPLMARQSWYGMAAYIAAMEIAKAGWAKGDGASVELALVIGAPALAYIGFRSFFDKFGGFGRLLGRKGGA